MSSKIYNVRITKQCDTCKKTIKAIIFENITVHHAVDTNFQLNNSETLSIVNDNKLTFKLKEIPAERYDYFLFKCQDSESENRYCKFWLDELIEIK